MAKLYNEQLPEKVRPLLPKKDTIKFLLQFSKALTVQTYQGMPFESIKN